jgi:hypothetical protein
VRRVRNVRSGLAVPVAPCELYRVIRPCGELRFNEHVRSSSTRVARAQDTADRLGWPRVSGGCHLARDTEALMLAAGFQIERLDRYGFGIPPLTPRSRASSVWHASWRSAALR